MEPKLRLLSAATQRLPELTTNAFSVNHGFRLKNNVLTVITCLILAACQKENNRIIPLETMDESFRVFMLENFDLNSDGVISVDEAALVKEMDVSGREIHSLDGIQYFPNLEMLNCSFNPLTSIDVSQNVMLKFLNCGNTFIKRDLNVSSNHELETLLCADNRIESLKINPELKKLDISNHSIANLDFSGHKSLKSLNCSGGDVLINLDVSHTVLDTLECASPKLALINLEGCSSLKKISYSGQSVSLDLTHCPNLEYISADNISTLDVSHCPLLKTLIISNSYLMDLDLKKNAALEDLSIDHLSSVKNGIDLSANFQLVNLFITNALKGSYLDLSNRNRLEFLYVNAYPTLESCNLEGCSSLKEAVVHGGVLTSFNLKGCTALSLLDCNGNQFTELDIEDCKVLTELDVSACYKLTSIKTNSEQLSKINCSNTALTDWSFLNNARLKELNCSYVNLTSLDLSKCPSLEILICNDNSLTTLDVSHCPGLSILNCKTNRLQPSLDVSKCHLLTTLDCMFNQGLTELILYRNHSITTLDKDNQTQIVLSE